MKKIMFVCTGNICRSAMAEALMKKIAREKGKNIEVYSCGTYAENNAIPTYEAITIMKEEYDINMKEHRATNIMNSNIEKSDLILCATNNHKILVNRIFPELKSKTYTIKEYAGEKDNLDISDPWGYGEATYRKCAREIYDLLNTIIDKI